MRKILSLGMILILSSCLPHLNLHPEKNQTDPVLTSAEERPSLFSPSELEALFSCDLLFPVRSEDAAPSSVESMEGMNFSHLELPISDESNDDFNLEVLPGGRLKRGSDFDIPIVINEKVEHFVQYFQTTLKNRFSEWLARSEKFIPFMRNVLKENGLPEDLVYLSLIESGFNPYAYSRSKASGPWQFIYLTGKRYGLRVTWWIDERRDPEKSTVAAAKYLKDLYDMFECWYLAAAGYNAGESKIATAMKRYRTEDFWELTKYRFLKQETKDYVPQMIAAALIAKDPEAYGFTGIEYQDPLQYDKVRVPPLMDLQLVAKASETSLEEIKDLNPELLRGCTPPEDLDYEIKIPSGKKDLFLKNLESLQPIEKVQFKTHRVKKGETIQRVASLYRVDVEPLLDLNRLRKGSRLSSGMDLIIPIPKTQDIKLPLVARKKPDVEIRSSTPREMLYTIKKGDSLWS
ncbi:MAG TPA: transglycosylase SLT domain-containing protein, partial [Thermodesulfobacteriota bacterium]|nr:transglycosylase SLT domain-containing protein [Thermodesulfobacteriota bacterium]